MKDKQNIDRAAVITMPYTDEEQLQTLLFFLEPIIADQRTEDKQGNKIAYITVTL